MYSKTETKYPKVSFFLFSIWKFAMASAYFNTMFVH